ncbi:MAG: type II secretion system GspH family protein [Muribaculaceae bacterium]|nr:type II secretion system GspH family protein [Muribaculaceae bacterium]
MKKVGFTLAEVLVTLGIIGIVAAMTIPNLITNMQKKQTASKLVKAISTLNQIIKLSENENGEFSTWEKTDNQEEFLNKYLRPYTKVMQTCNPIEKCGYKSDVEWLQLNGECKDYCAPVYGGRVPFLAMDGIVYTFGYITPGLGIAMAGNDTIIIIDINGKDKPNQFGKDIFFFIRDEISNSIIPFGADLTREEINKDCSKTGKGKYCAALIRENGWTIPDGYPFK